MLASHHVLYKTLTPLSFIFPLLLLLSEKKDACFVLCMRNTTYSQSAGLTYQAYDMLFSCVPYNSILKSRLLFKHLKFPWYIKNKIAGSLSAVFRYYLEMNLGSMRPMLCSSDEVFVSVADTKGVFVSLQYRIKGRQSGCIVLMAELSLVETSFAYRLLK
jgi:hypothetical protein